jgi:class 3 adenylate cyclase
VTVVASVRPISVNVTSPVWGDTVNVASRLEACSLPGHIQVSDEVRGALEHCYEFQPRGVISLRGKGRMTTAFLTGRKPEA